MRSFPRLLTAATFLAAVPFFFHPGPCAGQAKQGKSERIVVGPFKLGELFGKCEDRKGIVEGDGLAEEQIVKAMNEAHVYIIDTKTLVDGKWMFNDKPTLAVSGPLTYSLTDKKGRTVELQLGGVSRRGMHTDNTSAVPYRGFPFCITVKVTGYVTRAADKEFVVKMAKAFGVKLTEKDLENMTFTTGYNLGGHHYLSYDVQGKTTWSEDDAKQP